MTLECRQIDFCWPSAGAVQRPVLSSVDAVFADGTVSLVVGNTGTGKSTLLHLLAGLLHPTNGTLLDDGRPVSRWPPSHRDRWRRKVGIVFQHLALLPDLTVEENLLLPLIPLQRAWHDLRAAIDVQVARWDLADYRQQRIRAMSGGQRQRVAIARALVAGPTIVLADEPTAFQDDDHVDRILARLSEAAADGAVVVICSHDDRVRTSAHATRRWRLVEGRLLGPAPEETRR
jgi:putative ABC transport system ATP-binding protein